MEFLAFVSPEALEPIGVLSRAQSGTINQAGDVRDLPQGEVPNLTDRFARDGYRAFPGGDIIDYGILGFETEHWSSADDALAGLRIQWERRGEELLPADWELRSVFGSWVAQHPIPLARERFAAIPLHDLLLVAGMPTAEFEPGRKLSTMTPMFVDEDTLAVAVAPFEQPRDVDRALGFGLAYAQDRELVLVLPAAHAQATLRRAAFLDAPIRVITYEARTVLGRWTFTVEEQVIPSRPAVLAEYRDPLVTTVHQLSAPNATVNELVNWADAHPDLRPAHRDSYLAWHCLGRMVLRLRRVKGDGVEVTAGVNASKPSAAFAPAVFLDGIHETVTPDRVDEIHTAVDAAIDRRRTGVDNGHVEHLLQALLAEDIGVLNVRTDRDGPGRVRREFPAIRADGSRGYIDLLAVDAQDRIHVIETKIGSDPMLVLQALDYYIWALAHREALAAEFGLTTTNPDVVVDFVVGVTKTIKPIGPYTAPQAEALPGGLRWRCFITAGWAQHDLKVQALPGRTWPDGPRTAPPRFVPELHAHLAGGSHAPGPLIANTLLADGTDGIVPAARATYDDLAERGLLHGFVHHIRSSQAFAINLFGPLHEDDTRTLLSRWFDDVITAEPPIFEWSDPDDRLGELTPTHPHRTQVDVVLRGRTGDGRSVAALIEVKLSETDFGACSAFQAVGNDTREVCATSGPFGGDPAACFQLRHHGGETRRHYDQYLPVLNTPPPGAGCWFRGGLNQPMRNVALLHALLDTGEFDDAVFVLCAPAENMWVQHTWTRVRALFGPRLDSLDPAKVLALHRHPDAGALAARYRIPWTPTHEECEHWSWQIAAALVARHPGQFTVIETHPGGGQYDCLALYERPVSASGAHVDLNRVGSVHTFDAAGEHLAHSTGWADLASGTARVDDVVDEIERHLDLAQLRDSARADPGDYTVAVIAATTHAIRAAGSWSWRNGMLDTSGYGSGPRLDWFASFPTLTPLPPESGAAFPTDPAFGHWFLLMEDNPVLCLDPDANAHFQLGAPILLSENATPHDSAQELLARRWGLWS